MLEENKKLAGRVVEEVWNRGNFAVVDELIASDFVGHSPPDESYGPEGYKAFWGMLRGAFPDIHFTIEDEIAEGDKVASRWTAHATHKGQFQGIPPTGKQGTVSGISVGRVANGKFVEGWTNWDALGLMQQLGVLPAPGQAGR